MNINHSLRHRVLLIAGTVGVTLAALTLAPSAQARSNVYWSVGISAPAIGVGVSNAYPVYGAPAPVYVQPQPVYVQPRPVYVQPPPVYYGAPVVVRPPVIVAPAPLYPVGWGPRGFYRHPHRHWHGGGWRY